MDGLISNIESMKKIIDNYIPYLMFSGSVKAGTHMAVLSKGLGEILPQIIDVYDDERMAEYAEDRNYWPSQLERIVTALESGDAFMSYDALVNEFKGNLTLLQDLLRENGIE